MSRYLLMKYGDVALEYESSREGGAPVSAEGANRYVRDFLDATYGGRLLISLGRTDRVSDGPDVHAHTIAAESESGRRAVRLAKTARAVAVASVEAMRFRPEWIVCMSLGMTTLASWLAAALTGARMVLAVTGDVPRAGLRLRLAQLAARSPRTVEVLVCTPSVGAAVSRQLRPRVRISVYRPDMDAILDEPPRFRRLSERRSEALFVGRLAPVKGIDVLPEIAASLVQEQAGVLELVGEGPESGRLLADVERRGLGEAIVFAGALPHAQVLERMAGARLVVIPSRSEGVAKVAAEALIAGTPVVAFDVGGVRDTVTHGSDGVLVQAGDTSAFCEKVVRLMRDDDEWNRLAEGAHAFRRRRGTVPTFGPVLARALGRG